MNANFSRLGEGLVSIVRGLMQRIDYLALYRARVISQNEDGSLEVKPDDVRLPGISRVPIHYGIPGVSVKVAPGAIVDLTFQGGSPELPIAALWEIASVTELLLTTTAKVTVNAPAVLLGGDGNERPVARVGDLVKCVIAAGSLVTGTLSGAPFVGALTPAAPVYGVIQSGAVKTRAS